MKIQNVKIPQVVSDVNELLRYTSIALKDMLTVINGKISLPDNCDTSLVEAQFIKAASDLSIKHTLGRIPVGYIVVKQSVPMSIYDGASDATTGQISLRSSVVGTAKLLIF